MTEPSRHYPGVEEIRAAVTDDLDESLLMLMTETRKYVTGKGFEFKDISNQAIDWLEERIEAKRSLKYE
jgi:HD superfamily phosphohydrolase YqeK